MSGKKRRNKITSNETLFGILDAIRAEGKLRLTDLAAELSVSKSTVHRHLATLTEHEYVVKDGDYYRLSLKFLDIGVRVRNQKEVHRQMKDPVYSLANETGELVSFIVEERGKGVFIYRIQGEKGVRSDAYVGKHSYLHHTSAGKALLAHLPDEKIDEIIDQHGLPDKTDKTVTDRDTLLEELERIRDEKIAFSIDEHTAGLTSIGAPVIGHDQEVIGGMSVAGPTHRMTDEAYREEITERLLGTVNELELEIAYS